MIETFITILAWVGALFGTIVGTIHFFVRHDYNHGGPNGGPSIEKLMDGMNGFRKVYKPGKYFLIAAVCWAWLIAGWLQ